MEQLWSPWRSGYIAGFKNEPASSGCFLCQAAESTHDSEENLVVYRTEAVIVVLNRYPYNSGHLLISPTQHCGSLSQLPTETASELMRVVQMASLVIENVYAPHGMNVGANLGRAAGAGVPNHLHFHIVPRWNGDTNFMPLLSDTKVISEGLQDTFLRVREGFLHSVGG